MSYLHSYLDEIVIAKDLLICSPEVQHLILAEDFVGFGFKLALCLAGCIVKINQ